MEITGYITVLRVSALIMIVIDIATYIPIAGRNTAKTMMNLLVIMTAFREQEPITTLLYSDKENKLSKYNIQ